MKWKPVHNTWESQIHTAHKQALRSTTFMLTFLAIYTNPICHQEVQERLCDSGNNVLRGTGDYRCWSLEHCWRNRVAQTTSVEENGQITLHCCRRRPETSCISFCRYVLTCRVPASILMSWDVALKANAFFERTLTYKWQLDVNNTFSFSISLEVAKVVTRLLPLASGGPDLV